MKLIRNETLSASHCDASVRLSVLGAFEIVEDMVTEMMGDLHIDGVTCMREYGAMWVFVRNRVELRMPLAWGEKYTAECYISSRSGAKITVDTVLKKEEGIALASRVELCAVDLESGRIRRSSTVGIGENTPAEEPETEIVFGRDSYEDGSTAEEVTVRSSDIDYCRHTNNISYIRYLLNQYGTSVLLASPVKAVEVQYAGQTYEGDRLQIISCGDGRFSIRKDGKAVVNCTFSF